MDQVAAIVTALSMLSFVPVSTSSLDAQPSTPAESSGFEETERVLVEPGLVRVFHTIKGTVTVQPFRIDQTSLEPIQISPEGSKQASPVTRTIDAKLSGTGFSVSEENVIITNAHVVSTDSFLLRVIAETYGRLVASMLLEMTLTYGPEDENVKEFSEKVKTLIGRQDTEHAQELRASLMSLITFQDEGSSIKVVSQNVQATSTESVIAQGRDANVLHVPHNWLYTGEDVAVLSVDAQGALVPAIALATSTELVGNPEVSVYGYPASTDLDVTTLGNVTRTSGRITSKKKLSGTEITAYQVDAKVSKGSSGGPVVDKDGFVVGLITQETGALQGDNFAFALPISHVHAALAHASIEVPQLSYQSSLREGLAQQNARTCKRAIESYTRALSVGGLTDDIQGALNTRITECENLIASGRSLDTRYDYAMEWVRTQSAMVWVLAAGGFVLVLVLGGVVAVFARKSRNEKARIDELQDNIMHMQSDYNALTSTLDTHEDTTTRQGSSGSSNQLYQ